jgi:hypothetical protein
MKMEEEKSYETSVMAYDPTPCHYPEGRHSSNASSKSLKIYLSLKTSSSSSSYPSSSSSIGTAAHCGLWPVEKYPSIFPCHQLSIIF